MLPSQIGADTLNIALTHLTSCTWQLEMNAIASHFTLSEAMPLGFSRLYKQNPPEFTRATHR
jgi:hypothetical protein